MSLTSESTLHRGAPSALGVYATHLAYGIAHPTLRRPFEGPEARARLAGDERVHAPEVDKTFVIEIEAPATAVWPCLVPQLQRLAVGDLIPDEPLAELGLGVWRVVTLAAPTTLVLHSRRVPTTGREVPRDERTDEPTLDCSWAFVIVSYGSTCRLIVRVRARVDGARGGVIAAAMKRELEVGDTVMEWTMLEGIQARAEAAVEAGHAG